MCIVCNCGFPVGRHFSVSTADRPSEVWVGRTTASLQQAPVRSRCCALQGAARPLRLAALLFRLHSVACLSSLGPKWLRETHGNVCKVAENETHGNVCEVAENVESPKKRFKKFRSPSCFELSGLHERVMNV